MNTNYIDGFVAAVPTANRDVFKKHAEDAAVVFKEYGALKVVECWGDNVPEGPTLASARRQIIRSRYNQDSITFIHPIL